MTKQSRTWNQRQIAWVPAPAPPRSCCVTLGKSLNISVPLVSSVVWGYDDIYLGRYSWFRTIHSVWIINIHESSNVLAWGNVYRVVLFSTWENSYLSFKTQQKHPLLQAAFLSLPLDKALAPFSISHFPLCSCLSFA